jgi:hypothetical protein
MQDAAFCVCGPASLAREGVAIHPERLSALRFPHVREGLAKLGGRLPREKDDACKKVVLTLMVRSAKRVSNHEGHSRACILRDGRHLAIEDAR